MKVRGLPEWANTSCVSIDDVIGTQHMDQPLAPKFPLEDQPSATVVIPNNVECGPILSDNSRSDKRKSKSAITFTRRSLRHRPNDGTQDIDQVVLEIPSIDIEDDKEDGENGKVDETAVLELNKSPLHTPDETETNYETDENPGVADIKYKTMYINSQKKIEALMEENKELNKTLEHAIGKIDVYEKHSNVYSEVMNVIASLSKVNENLSSHVKRGYFNCQDGVRSPKKNRTGQS